MFWSSNKPQKKKVYKVYKFECEAHCCQRAVLVKNAAIWNSTTRCRCFSLKSPNLTRSTFEVSTPCGCWVKITTDRPWLLPPASGTDSNPRRCLCLAAVKGRSEDPFTWRRCRWAGGWCWDAPAAPSGAPESSCRHRQDSATVHPQRNSAEIPAGWNSCGSLPWGAPRTGLHLCLLHLEQQGK